MDEFLDTPEANNMVPLDKAKSMTDRWQKLINPETGRPFPKSYRLDKVDFQQLLENEEVEYINTYPGIEENGDVTLLVVGVNAEGNDIVREGLADSGIYDFALPCPKTCGESPLNHNLED